MIEFQLIDDTEDVEVNLIDNTENVEIELIKEIDSYNQLKDQPSINNVTLTGNKTLHDLGIQQEGDYTTITQFETRLAQKVDKATGKGLSTNDYTTPEKNKLASLENYDDTEIRQLIDTKQPRGNYITEETDPTVPNHVKTITQNNIANWNNKQEQLVSGTNIKTINNTSILGSGNIEIESGGSDYSELTNKPKINNVELNGNKTSSDLGLQPAGNYALKSEIPTVPTKVSAFTNDVGYLTSHQDLTNYVTNTDYATYNEGGVVKISVGDHGLNMDNGTLKGVVKTLAQYNDMSNKGVISKGTLENVIAGKSLVSSSDLATVATSGSYNDLSNKPSEVTESTVSGWGFTKNTGTYSKPSGGIPKTDLASAVQTSLGKADTALQSYTETDPTVPNHVKSITQANITSWNNKADTSDIPKYYYGTCATAAATRAKEVECEGFVLEEGATISVHFTYAQTYNGAPYLNVNETGNVVVQYKGGSNGIRYMWSAGEIIDFTYHDEHWVCHGRGLATTSYYGVAKLYTGAGSDSQSYASTPRSLYYFANYSIAPYYSASKTYAVGDKVRHNYYLYECTTAIETAEAWDEDHWQQIDTIQEQIDAINTTIGDIDTILTRLTTGSGV